MWHISHVETFSGSFSCITWSLSGDWVWSVLVEMDEFSSCDCFIQGAARTVGVAPKISQLMLFNDHHFSRTVFMQALVASWIEYWTLTPTKQVYNPIGSLHLHFRAFSKHFCPKRLTLIHAYFHTMAVADQHWPAHQYQYLAQGHFNMQTRWIEPVPFR